jgi:hypothetical protein
VFFFVPSVGCVVNPLLIQIAATLVALRAGVGEG